MKPLGIIRRGRCTCGRSFTRESNTKNKCSGCSRADCICDSL